MLDADLLQFEKLKAKHFYVIVHYLQGLRNGISDPDEFLVIYGVLKKSKDFLKEPL